MNNFSRSAISAKELTVVIPTYRRPKHLMRVLQAILAQTHPVGMVLIVDDSNGTACEIVERLPQGKTTFTCIKTQGLGPTLTRNKAIDQVQTEWVGFLDDDSIPEPSWAASCAQLFINCSEATAQLGRIVWKKELASSNPIRTFIPKHRQKINDFRYQCYSDSNYCNTLAEMLGRTNHMVLKDWQHILQAPTVR